ncbi:MAG: multicopper oxidase domain-containing protein [Chloroflexia bacterium]|nr:multicopper oxidase domain-containing protein [Chloroflexia bacterium]
MPMSFVSRRRVLAGGLAAGGSLLVAGAARLPRAAADDATPVADHMAHDSAGAQGLIPGPTPWESEDLVEPENRRSVDGVLETELHAQYTWKDGGGYQLSMRSYEGTIPGPTLRLQPGDTLKIGFHNLLPASRDEDPRDEDLPHHLNSTNFHFHGAHVSPEGISDNIFRVFEPGQSYDIEIELPTDHPSGTYWYHPHNHGSADIQIASGMAGAVIIEGDFAEVPEIAAATERVLLVNQVVFDEYRQVEGFETVVPEGATRFFTINGQREPIIRLRPGEVQRWRILHAGYQDDILMSLDGHTLLPIARDGIRLPEIGRTVGATQPASVGEAPPEAILFAPGQRVDVLVQAGEPGEYLLQALPYFQGYDAPTGPLAHIIVEGEPLEMALPTALPPAPFADITDEELTGTREILFSRHAPEVDAAGHWREFAFLVDDQLFDMNVVGQTIDLNAVEEWTITSSDEHNDHVFHIHVNPFQLVKVNGEPVAPIWLDTVIVPHGGSVTFRTRFLDFTGKYVLHCHMMNHEELGMMQVVEVI